MRVVVAGAAGFVGRNLVPALVAAGHSVACGSRDPERARVAQPDRSWVRFDVDAPETLEPALEGAQALVYLVHHLAAGGAHLAEHEARSATAVAQAAERAGLRRIVYLGGPAPSGVPSPHLAARMQTGEILRAGGVPCVELRAAMIVGAGSESWLICRDLALRLPVMVLPKWTASRTAPLAIDDAVFALVDAVTRDIPGPVVADLPGPEVLSGREILARASAVAGMRPVGIAVPLLTPRLSSLWLRLVTRADFGVARQLVDGLTHDLLPQDDGWWLRVPDHERIAFDEAVRRALRAEPPPTGAARLWERLARRVARSA